MRSANDDADRTPMRLYGLVIIMDIVSRDEVVLAINGNRHGRLRHLTVAHDAMVRVGREEKSTQKMNVSCNRIAGTPFEKETVHNEVAAIKADGISIESNRLGIGKARRGAASITFKGNRATRRA